ncbi:hypothetical protein H5410_018956 [Solanum commersonii]|uniref:Uncharacterized protein n=1 Tax=Solanum commersonii TaxID=4109 RepID=A0A9J6A4K8_SOLCO|nr:hypothetical protein H5410_018956 [Solanum commersonii]
MGDILHAEGATIDITTTTVAEAYRAILEACKHCKQSQHMNQPTKRTPQKGRNWSQIESIKPGRRTRAQRDGSGGFAKAPSVVQVLGGRK